MHQEQALEIYRRIQAQYIVPSKPAPAPDPVPEAGIKPITRYETPDGEVHDSEAAALIHMRYLSINEVLAELNIQWSYESAPDYLARYLAANGYELRKIPA